MQSVKRVSKAFYLVSNIGATVLSQLLLLVLLVLAVIAGIVLSEKRPSWELVAPFLVPGIIILVLALLLATYSTVISCILLYKAWEAIQTGHPRTTPGRAVGFLFIPFFNLYWMFQAVWGYALDYNKYVSQTGATSFRLNDKLFLSLPILTLAIVIPYLGSLAGIGQLVVGFICINSVCDAVNHLAAHENSQAALLTSRR
jgi:hypothetical protein